MAKKYAVKPRLQPGRTYYIATFYNSSGNRITRSLETDKHDKAGMIGAGLVTLWTVRVSDMVEALSLNVEPICLKLYFGENENADAPGVVTLNDVNGRILAQAHAEAMKYPVGMRAMLRPILTDRIRLQEQNDALRQQLGVQRGLLDVEKDARQTVERSIVAHAAKSAALAPLIVDARGEYEKHITAKVSRPRDYLSVIDRFTDFLTASFPDVQNIADVLPGHVSRFLDEKANSEAAAKKSIRRRNLRFAVGRFLNWSAQTYHIISPMSAVKAVSVQAVRRERGDIHWHSLEAVNAALDALPARVRAMQDLKPEEAVDAADVEYWRALIGTLAFAGLQLAELCWLRVADLEIADDRTRAKLWITAVDDPVNEGKRHLLKTDNRRRHVDVHPRYLLPLLLKHLATGSGGTHFLFPMHCDRKRRGLKADDERWRAMTLSTQLRGHKGSAKHFRKPTPGLLPKGMNAKSLRRTFGSLLIRSGKTSEHVAAAMGNTPAIVREHYARILGCEVDVDF